jgi:DNA-binding MarR family transcriptional regulator
MLHDVLNGKRCARSELNQTLDQLSSASDEMHAHADRTLSLGAKHFFEMATLKFSFDLTNQIIFVRISAMHERAVRHVMEHYPKIFFACHTRHVRDEKLAQRLTAHQASILDHLDVEQAFNLNDLAGHMGVTAATMCIAVDRLARMGYVLRERDKVDRRRVNLRLSAEGARLRSDKSVLDAERVQSVLARMSAKDRALALHGVALLAQAAQEYMQDQSTAKGVRGAHAA